eukprot:10279106-Alexandrium_andersonii.AAC.1
MPEDGHQDGPELTDALALRKHVLGDAMAERALPEPREVGKAAEGRRHGAQGIIVVMKPVALG